MSKVLWSCDDHNDDADDTYFEFEILKEKKRGKKSKMHRNIPHTDLHTTDKPVSVYLTSI